MEQEFVLRVGRAIAHTLAEPDAGSQLHGIVALVGHVEGNHVPFPGCLVEREDVLLSLCRHVLHPAQPKDVGSHQLQQEADISLFKKSTRRVLVSSKICSLSFPIVKDHLLWRVMRRKGKGSLPVKRGISVP